MLRLLTDIVYSPTANAAIVAWHRVSRRRSNSGAPGADRTSAPFLSAWCIAVGTGAPAGLGWAVLLGLLLLAALAYESRTSTLQSYLLPRYAAKLTFYAWHSGADETALARWLGERAHAVSRGAAVLALMRQRVVR